MSPEPKSRTGLAPGIALGERRRLGGVGGGGGLAGRPRAGLEVGET